MDETTIFYLYWGEPNLDEHGCYSTPPTCLRIQHPIISIIGSQPNHVHVHVHRKNEYEWMKPDPPNYSCASNWEKALRTWTSLWFYMFVPNFSAQWMLTTLRRSGWSENKDNPLTSPTAMKHGIVLLMYIWYLRISCMLNLSKKFAEKFG